MATLKLSAVVTTENHRTAAVISFVNISDSSFWEILVPVQGTTNTVAKAGNSEMQTLNIQHSLSQMYLSMSGLAGSPHTTVGDPWKPHSQHL